MKGSLRIHLLSLDKSSATLQTQSFPSFTGTIQLGDPEVVFSTALRLKHDPAEKHLLCSNREKAQLWSGFSDRIAGHQPYS